MLVQIEIHILIGIHLWWASHYLSMFVTLKDLPHPQVDQSYVCISRWWLHSQCKECTFVFWGWSGSQANQSVLCFQQGSTVDQGWPGKSQAVATQGNTVIVSRGRVQRERENIRILRGHYFQKYRMSLSTVCFFFAQVAADGCRQATLVFILKLMTTANELAVGVQWIGTRSG